MLNGKYKWLVAEVSLGDDNKPTTRNTRDANDFVHAKGLARKIRSASRVWNKQNTSVNNYRMSEISIIILILQKVITFNY